MIMTLLMVVGIIVILSFFIYIRNVSLDNIEFIPEERQFYEEGKAKVEILNNDSFPISIERGRIVVTDARIIISQRVMFQNSYQARYIIRIKNIQAEEGLYFNRGVTNLKARRNMIFVRYEDDSSYVEIKPEHSEGYIENIKIYSADPELLWQHITGQSVYQSFC